MQLEQLFEGVAYDGTLPQAQVSAVTMDSRRVQPGTVFVCTKGRSFDGHTFAQKALQAGAVLVVTDHRLGLAAEVVVDNPRQVYALLCHNYFGNPARSLKLVAVTGTNGKTTITYLIKQVLEALGYRCGLIGTIRSEVDQMQIPAKFTTPEAWDLAALFSRMVRAGCEYVIMEASSQALDQQR
ncbi:MAG: Mur ligase family protein, partial [Pygmaiobacter sp.]|nr:Mur ligase family protein [Pygmaiobacter sp.]